VTEPNIVTRVGGKIEEAAEMLKLKHVGVQHLAHLKRASEKDTPLSAAAHWRKRAALHLRTPQRLLARIKTAKARVQVTAERLVDSLALAGKLSFYSGKHLLKLDKLRAEATALAPRLLRPSLRAVRALIEP
jgi:hypothetical protein